MQELANLCYDESMLSQFENPQVTQILNSLLNYCHRQGGPSATLNYPSNDSCISSQGLTYLWSPTNPPTDAAAQQLEAAYQRQKASRDTITSNLQNLCTSMGGQTYQAAPAATTSVPSSGFFDFLLGSSTLPVAPTGAICAKGMVISNIAPDNIWSPAKPPTNPQAIQLENQLQQSQQLLAQALSKVANRCSDLSPNNSQVTYNDAGCSYHASRTIWSPNKPDPETTQLYAQLNALQGGGEILSNKQVLFAVGGFLGILLVVFLILGSF